MVDVATDSRLTVGRYIGRDFCRSVEFVVPLSIALEKKLEQKLLKFEPIAPILEKFAFLEIFRSVMRPNYSKLNMKACLSLQ